MAGFLNLLIPFCQVAGTILLIFLPGWYLLGLSFADPLTRFVIAVTSGLLILYLLEFGAYLFTLPQWVPLLVYLILCLVMAWYRKREKNASNRFPWEGILVWFGLSCWILALEGRIVTYGTVFWFGDWYEHYERSIFFYEQLPFNSRFLTGFWSLPARAPLFNANIAFLMNFFGQEFWTYQTLATVLNTFPVLPIALLIRDFGKVRQRTALVCGFVLCAVAPFAVLQETYVWTKFLSIGMTLAGAHFYCLGMRTKQPALVFWSFVAFAAGMLAHYMVLGFVVFFLAHLLLASVQKKFEIKHAAIAVFCSGLLVSTWIGYVFYTFGVNETLTANSTLGKYASIIAPNHVAPPWSDVFANNMITTLLPYSWRHHFPRLGKALVIQQYQPLPGKVTIPTSFPLRPVPNDPKIERYSDITANADSLTANLGWSGAAALILILVWSRRKPANHTAENSSQAEPGQTFWFLFFAIGIPLNVFFCRVYAPQGLAHINLQPYLCLAAVFMVRWLRDAHPVAKFLLITAFLLESLYNTFGILALENMPVALAMNGDQLQVLERFGLNQIHMANYIYKLQVQALYLSDHFASLAGTFTLIAALLGSLSLAALLLLKKFADA